MAEIKQTERAARVLSDAMACCREYRHEFIMPEHLLLTLIDDSNFCFPIGRFSYDYPQYHD